MDVYRSQFRPSLYLQEPLATICVSALACDTTEAAHVQFQTRARWRMDRNRGKAGPLLSPDEAVADLDAAELAELEALRPQALIGNPEETAGKLRALATSLQLQEMVVCTWAHDPAVQRRSFELLAQAFGMNTAPSRRETALA